MRFLALLLLGLPVADETNDDDFSDHDPALDDGFSTFTVFGNGNDDDTIAVDYTLDDLHPECGPMLCQEADGELRWWRPLLTDEHTEQVWAASPEAADEVALLRLRGEEIPLSLLA